jgi:hypothetical protein
MNAPPGAFVFLFGQFDNAHDLRTYARNDFGTSFYPAVNSLPFYPGIKVPMDQLGIGEVGGLLAWWSTRLDILYSHAADPTRFVGDRGEHDVAAQAAWFFTFERMLGDFAALSAAVNAPGLLQMQVAFDALDKCSSLLVGPRSKQERAMFVRLLSRKETLPRVEKAFDQLPMQARARFKEWAQSAYDRLYADVQAQTMPNRITPDAQGVKVGWSGPNDLRRVSWDEYVGDLIREARNASHGLLNMLTETPRQGRRARRLLLATNQGEVPASFFEVARVVCFALIADARALCDRSW